MVVAARRQTWLNDSLLRSVCISCLDHVLPSFKVLFAPKMRGLTSRQRAQTPYMKKDSKVLGEGLYGEGVGVDETL